MKSPSLHPRIDLSCLDPPLTHPDPAYPDHVRTHAQSVTMPPPATLLRFFHGTIRPLVQQSLGFTLNQFASMAFDFQNQSCVMPEALRAPVPLQLKDQRILSVLCHPLRTPFSDPRSILTQTANPLLSSCFHKNPHGLLYYLARLFKLISLPFLALIPAFHGFGGVVPRPT